MLSTLKAIRKADTDYFGPLHKGSVFWGLAAVAFGVMPYGFMKSRIDGKADEYDAASRRMVGL